MPHRYSGPCPHSRWRRTAQSPNTDAYLVEDSRQNVGSPLLSVDNDRPAAWECTCCISSNDDNATPYPLDRCRICRSERACGLDCLPIGDSVHNNSGVCAHTPCIPDFDTRVPSAARYSKNCTSFVLRGNDQMPPGPDPRCATLICRSSSLLRQLGHIVDTTRAPRVPRRIAPDEWNTSSGDSASTA